jgi:hypothetical protein
MTLGITRTNITQQDFRRISGKSSLRKPILIVGPAASTSTLAVNVAKRVTNPNTVVEFCKHGPMVEAACDSLTHENDVAIIMRTAASEPGEYVDVTGTFGNANAPTVAGDPLVLPEDDLEPGIVFNNGGTLGTTGITYSYRTGCSLSAGLKGPFALGTATAITLPLGAGKYVFTAPQTPLVTLVNELRTDLIAHFALTSGSVHGAADATSGTGIGSAATDIATAIVLANQLRTAYEAHRVLTSGSVHGAADATNVISAAAATTSFGAVALVNEIKADYEAHRQLTTGSVHGAADATNVISAAAASPGVINAGDKIEADLKAPRWSITELGQTLDEVLLLPASYDYDGILLCGPVLTKVEADAIAQKVEALRTKARWRRLQPQFRIRNNGESLSDYSDAYGNAFGTVEQRALHGAAVSWYVQSSHPDRFGQVDARPFSFAYFNRLCTLKPDINPADETDPPNGFGSFTRGYVRDPANPKEILPRAVDDGHTELFTPQRAVAPRTKNQVSEGIVFPGQGAMFAPNGSDFYIAPYARGIDEGCNVAFRPLEKRLGRKVQEAVGGTIEPNERKRIEAGITQDLDQPLVKSGIARSVQVLLDPNALINTPPPVVVPATIVMDMDGYIDRWEVDISLS